MGKKFGPPPLSKSDVSGDTLRDAAKDILEAIADKDPDALAAALKLAYGHCADESDEAADTAEDDDDDDDY